MQDSEQQQQQTQAMDIALPDSPDAVKKPKKPRVPGPLDDAKAWFADLEKSGCYVKGVDPTTGLCVDREDPHLLVKKHQKKDGTYVVAVLPPAAFASYAAALDFLDRYRGRLSADLYANIKEATEAAIAPKVLKSQRALQTKAAVACENLVKAVMEADSSLLDALLEKGLGKPVPVTPPKRKRASDCDEAAAADAAPVSKPKRQRKKAPVDKGVLADVQVDDADELEKVRALRRSYPHEVREHERPS